jgi:hypothetical protein
LLALTFSDFFAFLDNGKHVKPEKSGSTIYHQPSSSSLHYDNTTMTKKTPDVPWWLMP